MMVKVSGQFAKRLFERMPEGERRRIMDVARSKAHSLSIKGEGYDSLPGTIKPINPVMPGDRLQPVQATARGQMEYAVGDPSASAMGAVLIRRPTQLELEMGAEADDFILASPGVNHSPFASHTPVDISITGKVVPLFQLAQEPVTIEDVIPLYGDATSLLNRLVDGGVKGVKSIASKFDWNEMSPATKALLIGTGAIAGGRLISKALPSTLMYRIGLGVGARGSDGDGDSKNVFVAATPNSSVEAALSAASIPVDREAELLSLGKSVYPVSNNFLAGAYALGKEYHSRRSQPNFGLLGGDPYVSAKALSGLRAPKWYLEGSKIFRTSAPYSVFYTQHVSPLEVAMWWKEHPLQGGIFGDVASDALAAIKDAATGAFKKIKEWIGALINRIKEWWRKKTAPHTHWCGRAYSISMTPLILAAKFWSVLGRLSDAVVQEWAEAAEADAERLQKMKDDVPETWDATWAAVQSLARAMEAERKRAGIPSRIPWTQCQGSETSGKEYSKLESVDILKQYAPQTAKHVMDLINEFNVKGSDSYIPIFDTRNPPLIFSDQAAFESDVRNAAGEAAQELEARLRSEEAATPVVNAPVVITDGASAQDGASSTASTSRDASPAAAPGPSVVVTSGAASDPTALATVLGAVKHGTVDDIPRAWLAQLPESVQYAYYGQRPQIGAEGTALVGDAIHPAARNSVATGRYNAYVKASSGGAPYEGALPAIATFFLLWVLPTLLELIPWKKVGTWFTKNASKARVLKTTSKTSAELAKASASSGGALASITGALKTLLRKGGKMGRALATTMVGHPRLTALGLILAACFCMGSSYSGDKNSFAQLLRLLRDALREVESLGFITKADYDAHASALDAISSQDPTRLTEAEAQEIQTVVMICHACAMHLVESEGEAALANHEGLASLESAIDRVSDNAESSAAQDDLTDLQDIGEQLVAYYAGEELLPRPAATVDVSTNPGQDSNPSMPDSATTANSKVAAALASVGAGVAGSAIASTGKPASAASPLGVSGIAAPASGESTEAGQLGTSDLTEDQLGELQILVDANQALSDQQLQLEAEGSASSIKESVEALLRKWGLPVAGAAALTALVIAAIRARRSGKSVDPIAGIQSLIQRVSSWWKSVVKNEDPSAPVDIGDSFTGVAL